MTNWNVSEEAAALHRDAVVWDMLIPLGGHSPINASSVCSQRRRTVDTHTSRSRS
jgi:hypothetical protein